MKDFNGRGSFREYCEQHGVEVVAVCDAGMYGNRDVYFMKDDSGQLYTCGGYDSMSGGFSCYFASALPCKWSDIRFSKYETVADWRKRCIADAERFIKELILNIGRLRQRQSPSNWRAMCKREFNTIKKTQSKLKYHMRKLQDASDYSDTGLRA